LGQNDVARGQPAKGSDTATETIALIEQANFRFDLSIRLLKHESIIPMLDMIADRNIQFWPFEKEIKRYREKGEPQFMNVPVSKIIGRYRFMPKTNPARGNKLAFAQTLMRFLEVINVDQGRNPGLVREIGKFLEIDNMDELLKDPCKQALRLITQAADEGLLSNARQAAAVLAKVVDIIAPRGSDNAQIAGTGRQPAQNEQGIAQQVAQGARTT